MLEANLPWKRPIRFKRAKFKRYCAPSKPEDKEGGWSLEHPLLSMGNLGRPRVLKEKGQPGGGTAHL